MIGLLNRALLVVLRPAHREIGMSLFIHSCLKSSSLHSHATFYLELCDKNRFSNLPLSRYCIAKQPAPAPHLAHPGGCAARRIALVTAPRVSHSYEHFPDGFDLHLLQLGSVSISTLNLWRCLTSPSSVPLAKMVHFSLHSMSLPKLTNLQGLRLGVLKPLNIQRVSEPYDAGTF